MTPQPFKIEISKARIERLKQKLALTDYSLEHKPLDANDWRFGVPTPEIKRLGSYWQHEFDFDKVVAELNRIPQYTLEVDVSNFGPHQVHFVHQRSRRESAIPFLFLHGWPGSFLEVTKMLDGLVDDSNAETASFDVVAPSLINFGFSSASSSPDFNVEQHAETYHKLMLSLGYDQYVVQSGDVGNLITRFIAKEYGPAHCKACHTNTPWPAEPKEDTHPELYSKLQSNPLTENEVAGLQRAGVFAAEGSGYFGLLATKPHTVGVSLRDSPIGLLAWMYEKLHDWSDDYPWTEDEILTWISIYYISSAGPEASGLIYYAMQHSDPPALATAQTYIDVPLGMTSFANDLVVLPRLWSESLGPIVFENEHARGGHFGAWERPEAIVADLRSMFGRGGGAYSCVADRSGFAEKT